MVAISLYLAVNSVIVITLSTVALGAVWTMVSCCYIPWVHVLFVMKHKIEHSNALFAPFLISYSTVPHIDHSLVARVQAEQNCLSMEKLFC